MRRTLVDVIRRDIHRSDDVQGPDWTRVVEDAVLRHDMEWLLAAERYVEAAVRVMGPR